MHHFAPMVARKVFLSVTFLLLAACFFFHVYGSVEKFVRGMTTVASTIRWGEDDGDDDRGLWMPSMAICPGYRPRVSRDLIRRGLLERWPLPNYFDSHPEDEGIQNGQDMTEPKQERNTG